MVPHIILAIDVLGATGSVGSGAGTEGRRPVRIESLLGRIFMG